MAISPLTIATWNVRYAPGQDLPSSSILTPPSSASSAASTGVYPRTLQSGPRPTPLWGERRWSERLPLLVDQIAFFSPTVLCLQEVLHHQLVSLSDELSSEYDHVGVGRDDGDQAGEAVPIFWRRDQGLAALEVRHFWLSKTPDVPGSKDWDAVRLSTAAKLSPTEKARQGQTRMVTMVKFRQSAPASTRHVGADPPRREAYYDADLGPDILFQSSDSPAPPASEESGLTFWVLNTHWDDRGRRSRAEAAKLILGRARQVLDEEGDDTLLVLAGDLNSPEEEEGYRILTGHRYVSPAGRDTNASSFLLDDDDALSPMSVVRNVFSSLSRPVPGGPTFRDARRQLARRRTGDAALRLSAPFGDSLTYTGFNKDDRPELIDFIMVLDPGRGGESRWEVTRFGVVPNRFETGFFVSDHRLVLATLTPT